MAEALGKAANCGLSAQTWSSYKTKDAKVKQKF